MGRARRPSDQQSALRRRAETRLRQRRAPALASDSSNLDRTLHELEIHQVELELQNEELRIAHAELAATRDRYASLFSLAPTGYLVLDRTGTILEANEVARLLLRSPRYRPSQWNLVSFVVRDEQPAVARHLEEAAATVGTTRLLRVTLEGLPRRIVRLETVREPEPAGAERHYRTTMIDVTDQVLGEERLRTERMALERSQAALRELTRRLMVAEENERRRIAADLHDDIGQRLHAVQMEFAVLRRHLSGQGELSAQARTVHRHLERVVIDLEGLTRHLHPKIVDDLGLSVALQAHAEELERRTGMVVRVRERAMPAVVSANVATCLYRVAQEALRNVHRHAGTQAATVTLAGVRRGVGLCVADSGRGFAPEQVRLSGRGLGLMTMKERVGAFDGHFRVRTSPGQGAHVHAWVPLP